MTDTHNLYDVVALLEDVPSLRLCRGQVGTIVEVLVGDVYEVEFSDSDGRPYAMAAIKATQLMTLHYAPNAMAS
jgi:hypothetical protein